MTLLADPRFMEAVALHKAGRFEEANAGYQALLEENPTDSDLWHFKGLLALHRGEAQEAIRLINLAITVKPGLPAYFGSLSLACEAAGQAQTAAEAANRQGNALQEQCLFAEAIPCYSRALSLWPAFQGARVNRGAAADRLGDYAGAAADFELVADALADASQPADLMNLANALSGLTRADEAIAAYDRVLAVEPGNATAHCSRALLLLRQGRMQEGWRDYEWRWQRAGGFREPRGQFREPLWQGQSPEELGGPLLVIAEQGLGDTIQFARYIPLLLAQGHEVIFETLPPLQALFAEGMRHPRLTVIPRIDDPLRVEGGLPFAAWIGVMSLPHRLGGNPAEVPYLAVDNAKVERWRALLNHLSLWEGSTDTNDSEKQAGEGLNEPAGSPSPNHGQSWPLPLGEGFRRIGLVWAGNPKNLNDHARSIPPQALASLWQVPGVRYVSLQKGPADAHDFGDAPIVGVDADLTDMTETAAAIMNLDLVIAVDTSVAHLAGALGKPVWLLIPDWPDWRWLNEGESSAWYPTMRIFRQTERGQWGDVVEQVAGALMQV